MRSSLIQRSKTLVFFVRPAPAKYLLGQAVAGIQDAESTLDSAYGLLLFKHHLEAR